MKSINNEQFTQYLTLAEAYRTMFEFLVAYHERGESQTGVLLSDIRLLEDGSSADPAQLQDFLDVFKKVKQREQP
jgi:hypothetical protein